MGLRESFGYVQHGLTYLVFAPFVALTALFGLLFISLSYAVKAVESLIGITGWTPNLGGEFLYEFGKKNLPNFYFS